MSRVCTSAVCKIETNRLETNCSTNFSITHSRISGSDRSAYVRLSRRAKAGRRARAGLATLGAAGCTAAVMAMVSPQAMADTPAPVTACPDLVVLGVQGTGESSPTADPLAITGMIGHVFGPLLARDPSVGHVTIPYAAGFGGAPGTGPSNLPFATSATEAGERLDATASDIVVRCPGTRLALVGFSQGGGVVSEEARRIGAGDSSVSADRVGGVAIISDWTRPNGGEQIPGRPGQVSPDPPPGADNNESSPVAFAPVPFSGGIAPDAGDFGALTGRVAEFCTAGDLSCDAPAHAEVLRAAGGVAARANLSDPLTAAQSLTSVAASAVSETTAAVVLDDVYVANGQVSYSPSQPISTRLADAADPRQAPPTPDQQQAASEGISQAAAAIVADPLGQIPRLAGQISAAINDNLAANADLADPAAIARYAGVVGSHTSYAANGVTRQVADWFADMSRDLQEQGR